MRTVTVKLSKETSDEIELLLKRFHYSTKTDFFREAIREKIHKLEVEAFARELLKYKGFAKKKTTDKEWYGWRKKYSKVIEKELDKEFNLK
ncbi:MAG: ribbon-helix-helix domain-containing protein [archaeon]